MQKVSEELAAELKSLYQEKKFSELIYKINANFGENTPAGILNLLGAAKLLVAISDEEILSARQTFKDAFLKDKSLSEALYNYINLSTDVDDMDEALLLGEEYKKNFGYEKKVFHSLARLHRNLGNLKKSYEYYETLINKNDAPKKAWCSFLMTLNYENYISKDKHFNYTKQFVKTLPTYDLKSQLENVSNNKKVRIGFISPDFRNHSVAYFLVNTLKNLNKEKYELYGFSNTKKERHDEFTSSIKAEMYEWNDINDMEDKDIIELIRSKKVSILFDLTGYFSDNKITIFKNRSAPIQVSWCGYTNTTGLDEMDYIIADPYVIKPEEEKFYTEKILRLSSIWNSHSGLQIKRKFNEMPMKKNNYITFCSFNNFSKISELNIKTWSKALRKIKNSKLLLKPSGKINYQKLYKMFENEKVINQIIFLKNENNFEDHINQYSKADIALDTFPYNGATTSFEAIWMGVPVLTIKGNNFVGRYGESINTNLGLKNLIVENEDEYVNTMIDFSNDQKKVENIRDLVFKNALNSALFDTKNFTKELEKAIDEMINNAL